MVNSLNTLREYIKKDFSATGKSNFVRELFVSPIIRCLVLLRVNEYIYNKGAPVLLRVIPYLWFKRLSIRLGFSIPLNVIGSGLSIVHYGLLVISPHAKIGKNCRIHAGVNIGGAAGLVTKTADLKAPDIGNNCYIGPGAKIFGDIKIGDHCVIGANSVVNTSFNDNGITIAGVPAKKISNKSSKGMMLNEL
jgi:serine O-acetyltransferase